MTLFAVSIYMHLPFLLLVISLVYGASRYEDWNDILYETFRWGSRMALFILAIATVLFLISHFLTN